MEGKLIRMIRNGSAMPRQMNMESSEDVYFVVKYVCIKNPPKSKKGSAINARKNQPYDFLAA